jgi:murein L,D-transpeptidase YafK
MENSNHQEHLKSATPLQNSFWGNLKNGYDLFKSQKQELTFTVNSKGDYLFK